MGIAVHAQHLQDVQHSSLRDQLDQLGVDFRALEATPQLMAPWGHMDRCLRNHLDKEEELLFPVIVALDAGVDTVHPKEVLDQLNLEHDTLRTLEAALRAAAPEAQQHEDDLLALLDELIGHLDEEEEHLFPAAMVLGGDAPPEAASTQPTYTAPPKADSKRRRLLRIGKLAAARIARGLHP